MTEVEVARLRLRCGPDQADRTRFAIEDGLRTTLPDDRRLTLLRRMRVAAGAGSSDPARRQEAVRNGWVAAVAGARHGGEDGADGANCVWFESREEAERLLLSRLLAGRRADGWYWRLAVPAWRGQKPLSFLAEALSAALAEADDRRVLAIARGCVAAGASESLAEALVSSAAPAGAAAWAPSRQAGRPPATANRSASAAERTGTFGAFAAPIPLPPGLSGPVARLVGAGGDGPAAARAIVRAWAVRRSPALALAPPLLAAAVAATLDEIRAPGSRRPPPPAEAPDPPHAPPPSGEMHLSSPVQTAALAGRDAPCVDRDRSAPRAPDRPDLSPSTGPQPAATEAAPAAQRAGRHSRHAGLWLVLPSLVQLGFREWLAERPLLLADHPGRRLLHTIARHYRIGPDDPVLAVLGEPPETGPDAERIGWWRHGLDRWLRRTARRRLHDLVNRAGRLDWEEWRMEVRFPGADADIALRRLALDRDPGWTDWLGLSVRYHFGAAEDRQ